MIKIKNEGKRFEDSISNSIPDYVLVKRLNDNAAGWSGGTNTRFSSNNECDFILFDDVQRILIPLELKSTKEKYLTFWREDFENKSKKQTFMIRKCQILGLYKWSKYKNVIGGFIINFKSIENKTYFVSIEEFKKYTSTIVKKSINIQDVLNMNPIEIKSTLLRTNYRYDIDSFLYEIGQRHNNV